jgi:hypothetical protein
MKQRMPTLLLGPPRLADALYESRRTGFWRRQFGAEVTKAQTTFDIAFGILIPVGCFALDPIVFRGASFFRPDARDGFLGQWQVFAYCFSAIQICTLAVWLIWRDRLGRYSRVITGLLISGALFSVAVGILILPLSLIGLVFMIGALGFIPFFTGIVYLRNAARAEFCARSSGWSKQSIQILFASALLSLAFPLGAQRLILNEVETCVAQITSASPGEADAATSRLRWLGVVFTSPAEGVYHQYFKETDERKRGSLSRAYQIISGSTIEETMRLWD